MVNFSRRWNGDGCFSPTMEWRWSLKILTITIDGSWQDQPLATMVFQWFFQFWGPMVHDGYWKGAFNNTFFFTKKINIRDKMRVYKDVKNRNALCPKLIGTLELINRDPCSRHYKKRYLLFQKLSLVCLISASARHKGRKFTTIAKNQWLLRWPLPLMEWYLLNYWDQWFFDGFSVSQPLATMLFNCCQPLVQRCDGNDTSFPSSLNKSSKYCWWSGPCLSSFIHC